MIQLQQFAQRFMKLDPEFGYVTVAFLIACVIWASPLLFLRDSILGKLVMVSAIIALTLYHRIAGIVALVAVIAMLNRNPIKEGLTLGNPFTSSISSTPAPISFKSSAEFRQKYCLKGVADDPTQSGTTAFNYMLSPAFFTLDASGNPTMTMTQMDALGKMEPISFNKCTPLTVKNGGHSYETIHNICDPACDWSMNDPTPSPSPAPPSTATGLSIPTIPPSAEGFTPMLRPHIRSARHFISDGMDNLKSTANRLKRKLF
jgi:hypothetical protein